MRLNDNVYVAGKLYPKGCRPPAQIADQIGEHAWEDGDPTVAAPPLDDEPVAAAPPEVLPVDPATLDGATVAPLDDEPDVTPEPAEPSPPVEGSATPDDDEPDVAPAELPQAPKRAGRGATRESWVEYAAALRINVTEDMSRDDIIAACDAAATDFPT